MSILKLFYSCWVSINFFLSHLICGNVFVLRFKRFQWIKILCRPWQPSKLLYWNVLICFYIYLFRLNSQLISREICKHFILFSDVQSPCSQDEATSIVDVDLSLELCCSCCSHHYSPDSPTVCYIWLAALHSKCIGFLGLLMHSIT